MASSVTTRCSVAVLSLLIDAVLPVLTATGSQTQGLSEWMELMWEHPVAISDGITLRAYALDEPRPMKVFVAKINLTAPGIGFTATGRAENWGERMSDVTNEVCFVETRLEKTADFMLRRRAEGVNVEVAVNTTYWMPFPAPKGNSTADPVGWCVSDGVEVSRPRKRERALVVHRDGTAEITSSVPTGSALADVAFAASGSALILEGGAEVENLHPIARELHPRTALGLSQDRKTLVLMVVDGRQSGYSEGADFADLARLLRVEGCSDALNMDGGGSSSLVVFDHKIGEPVMLNHHAGGVVRATAVNIGITLSAGASTKPETWFHIIGGNASKEGLAADIAAVADAGISGISLFHGGGNGTALWPGVTNGIPCMSENWVDLIKFAETECHRHGLTFKMQNCPGWSMSGGPWIMPDRAMRKLVCFEPGKKPEFDADDDYHEIGEVEFPIEAEDLSIIRSLILPAPSKLNRKWCFEPGIVFEVWSRGKKVIERECPVGTWADTYGGPGLEMTFDVRALPREGLELRTRAVHDMKPFKPVWSSAHRLDNWQAKAGRTLRQFEISTNAASIRAVGTKRLVFGHVNMKRKNHPAPPEATGWECDKMDPRGFEANFAGYVGRLIKAGVKVDGILVDSWECGSQSWTWKMEDEFKKRTGYALRPWLPALFGYILGSEAETEKFLLDWRNVCSRLVEENYYGTIARLVREHGMSVVYETAFGDVIPGDILRFWKYADEPMCEFWNPHDNNGYVGSFDFKPILPCASAAHIYRKRRMSAEAFTSFELTFDESFKDWKKVLDEHYARGVTHIVYNTFTHNPVIGGKPPSSSYGDAIGSPFLREQTWWPYLKHFSKYIERCGCELERGVPAVDILMYLGDDVNHKPSESKLLFGGRYKYDYLNNDVLMNALDVAVATKRDPPGADVRLVVGACPGCEPQTESPTYRVLWIPKGTFLLPATEAKIATLAAKGARVVRGDFEPDWPSPVKAMLGIEPSSLRGWYQRRDGDENIFFVVEENGRSAFYRVKNGQITVFDPVTGKECGVAEWRKPPSVATKKTTIDLKPIEDYPIRATKRIYEGAIETAEMTDGLRLDLGKVRDWATVYVNGRKVADLWCEPYVCDISQFVEKGRSASIRVEVVSTWYNALAEDTKLPEKDRRTWTLFGPKADAKYHDAGLLGPVRLEFSP